MRGGLAPLFSVADNPRSVPLPMPFWYRADIVTLVAGSKVSVISDLSGNLRDQLQAVDANRFVWGAATGPNGTPGLTGAGSSFTATAGNIDMSGATKLTLIYVLTPATLDTVGVDGLGATYTTSVTNPEVYSSGFSIGGHDTFQVEYYSAGAAALASAYGSNPAAPNSPVIVEMTADQTISSNQATVLINGTAPAQTRTFNGNPTGGFGAAQPLFLGRNYTTPTQAWKGVIAEHFGYFGIMSAQQRQNLYRGYLSPRYGITVP